MTYQELMAALQAYQAQNGATYQPTMWGGSGQDGYSYLGDAVPNNTFMLPGGQVATYDPQARRFMVASGDTGRMYVNADGSITAAPDLIDRSTWDSVKDGLPVLGAGALLALGGTALAGGLAGAGGAGTAGATAGTAGSAAGTAGTTAGGAATTGGMFSDVLAGGYGSNLATMPNYLDPMAAASVAAPAAATGGVTLGGSALSPYLAPAGASALSTLGGSGGGAGSGFNLSSLGDPRLLSAALGAGAAIAGNSDITSSRSTTSSLAPWLQQNAQELVARTGALSSGPQTNGALDTSRNLLTGYATQGDPLVNSAMSQQQNVIGGGMLGSNPYIDRVAQGIGDRMGEAYATGTRAGTFSTFNNDGNSVMSKSGFGQVLGNQDRAFGDSLGQTMSNLYYGNYANERAAQDAAARSSINFGNFGVQNAQNLANVGQADWQRPFQANVYYGNAINPAYGSTSTSTQNISAPNNFLAGAGGAAAGLGIWDQIFNNQRRP